MQTIEVDHVERPGHGQTREVVVRGRPHELGPIVSANVQKEIIARARELNAGFIPKPLTDEALAAFLSGAALRLKKVAP